MSWHRTLIPDKYEPFVFEAVRVQYVDLELACGQPIECHTVLLRQQQIGLGGYARRFNVLSEKVNRWRVNAAPGFRVNPPNLNAMCCTDDSHWCCRIIVCMI